ncbi:hypothetical protein HUS23_00995 [Ectothiorhodospiraceae bacterium 2226]|nr:hypothetical protein HUS23_00995 [Ectothiorhodospiraceae bacterium 2226]
MYKSEEEKAEAAAALAEAADLLRVAQEGLHKVRDVLPPPVAERVRDVGADTHALRMQVEQLLAILGGAPVQGGR